MNASKPDAVFHVGLVIYGSLDTLSDALLHGALPADPPRDLGRQVEQVVRLERERAAPPRVEAVSLRHRRLLALPRTERVERGAEVEAEMSDQLANLREMERRGELVLPAELPAPSGEASDSTSPDKQ